MIEPTKPQWTWRRLLTYFGITALLAIATIGVVRTPDPQWVAIAAIICVFLMHTVYVTSATWDGITRFTQAIAEGIQAAKGDNS